jgi:predicted SnoaL-like aldol condensation-catalyzing enzyme
MSKALDTANTFLKLTSAENGDIAGASRLMTDDVQFIGPLMRLSGRNGYAALLGKFLPARVATKVLRQFSQGDEVCSIDELVVRTPAGGTVTLTMAEWFRLRGGKIAEHRIFYGPREFASAFGIAA